MVYQYRIRSGEVLGASTDASAYTADTYFGVIADPPTPDGTDLGVPKIYDGSVIRNATAGEIATFASAAATDENLQDRDKAVAWLNDNPIQRKILSAIVAVMVDELNILRQWDASLKSGTNAAGAFAAFKTAVAALPATADRTLAQAKTSIVGKITSGAVD